MDKDRALGEILKRTERGRGRRVAIMVCAVIVFAVMIGVVVVGFRGRHISQNSAAMTKSVAAPTKVEWKPWWMP
jgi:uncharacterized membrane protein affecting hemolysin expression